MNFNLKKPCKNCPFRSDKRGYLGYNRAKEIAEELLQEKTFSCHNHNDFDENGDAVESEKSEHCYGAMVFLMNNDRPNIHMRLAHTIQMIDLSKIDHPNVYSDVEEMAKKHSAR